MQLDQQKINYIFSAIIVALALVLGYFGFTLPVQPVIPPPLPTVTPVTFPATATPVDLVPLAERVEWLELQSAGVDAGASFGISNVPCYQAQGGATWVAGSGCTWEVQSGGTIDLQAGSTINLSGFLTSTIDGLTVNGNAVVTGTSDLQGAISDSAGDVTIADHLDVQNTLNYGTSNLYPIGSEDSNFQFSWGSDTITGTAALTTQKVGSPTAAWCTISAQTFTATHCSTLIVGTTVTASVWLSDGAASPVGVAVDWLVIGIP